MKFIIWIGHLFGHSWNQWKTYTTPQEFDVVAEYGPYEERVCTHCGRHEIFIRYGYGGGYGWILKEELERHLANTQQPASLKKEVLMLTVRDFKNLAITEIVGIRARFPDFWAKLNALGESKSTVKVGEGIDADTTAYLTDEEFEGLYQELQRLEAGQAVAGALEGMGLKIERIYTP